VRRRDLLAGAAGCLGAGRLARVALAAPRVSPAAKARVASGLDLVAEGKEQGRRGRRVGLVAHAASVAADGRHAIDVLLGAGLGVVRLFGPEHGLRGRAAAGETIAGGVDAESGLPVVSLYGERTKPRAEDLRDLDLLVIDLQDAGVRFYTYVSTMLLCLEAAAEIGLEVLVLDRPNPLGGERVDGPERDPDRPFSLVSVAPGPLVHGLTLGEMARLANGRLARPARLGVVAMDGWERRMTWEDTGRSWVSPSPNLRRPEAALAYPGTCLLEGTSVSEGRGTEAPFLLFGAPWMKAEAVAREATAFGFALVPERFTPASSPAAPKPKYLGEACSGLRVRAADGRQARPWAFGLQLLAVLRRLHPEFTWTREGAGLDTLIGTKAVRAALERGDGVEAILAAEAPAVERWTRERKPALLY
jgi:uncharacterized protein YbbC (DUF1343 family)